MFDAVHVGDFILEPIYHDNRQKQKDQPLVSVLIPVYNTQQNYLLESVHSVLKQTYPAFEILIVNDGSSN